MDEGVCACGRRFTQPAIGRRRKWCTFCSPPDRRHDPGLRAAEVIQLPQREPTESDQRLTNAVKRKLEEWAIVDQWEGEACLALARLIDAGKHGASGAAGTVKALREAMDFANQRS